MISSLIFVFIVLLLTSATVEDEYPGQSAHHKEGEYCLLPPYPEHGKYTVSNYPSATPGQSYPCVKLDISCDIGYLNNNTVKSILCINRFWSATMPRCVPDLAFCALNDDLRIEYQCLSVPGSLEPFQACPSLVPTGTVVRPICRSPAYFSLRVLSEMHCNDGIWNYNPICKPACGLIAQHRKLDGSSTKHIELPWHALIYEKISEPFEPCSGSLITANKIISVATCFFDFKGKRPASDFMVAVNKMYRDYNDSRDVNSQYADVVDIKIPYSYRGSATNFEDDIAIVVVERHFFFHLSHRPVCLDFDNNLDRTQLTEGNSGKAFFWSMDRDSALRTEVLSVVGLPYIKFEDCCNMLRNNYRHYLTNDKFCARPNHGTWLNSYYDFGAGIAFLESTTQRYYLRGVVSNAFSDSYTYIFTSIVKHEHFIKLYL